MTESSYTVSNYQVTHLVAPARLAKYMSSRDDQGLPDDDRLMADRLLAEYGDLVSVAPLDRNGRSSRARATRADPTMAEFTFVSTCSPW